MLRSHKVQLDDTKYVKIVYNVIYRDLAIKPNSISWEKSVRHVLQSTKGLNNVWMRCCQGVGKVNLFIRIFKERLNDTFIQKLELRIDRIFACKNICTIL